MSGAELAEPRETPCIERLLGLLMDLGQDFRSHSRSHDRALNGPRLDRVVHHAGMIVIQFCVQFSRAAARARSQRAASSLLALSRRTTEFWTCA